MQNELMLDTWPYEPNGHVSLRDTSDALSYAALVWDDKPLCERLAGQLENLRDRYESLKAQPTVDIDKLSELAFAIQFTREALEETANFQARARNFVRFL